MYPPDDQSKTHTHANTNHRSRSNHVEASGPAASGVGDGRSLL